MAPASPNRGTARRLLWFAALYAAGLGTVGLVAWLLRAAMRL